jgi:nucleotide sugar dehydrogenase
LAEASTEYGPGTTVAVIGLGKVGLPVAAQYASRGLSVIGCDTNPEVVAAVNRGRAHIQEEPELAERVERATAAGRLRATADTVSATREADVVVVIVPVVADGHGWIDFSRLDAATAAIGQGLRTGTLVIFESTLPVGTTRGRLGALLERVSGLRAGRDFGLAFSPERVYSGRIFRDLRRYPKIVGGVDRASGAAAVRFYRAGLEFDPELGDEPVWQLSSAEAAELSKLVETVYRDVNIALANQFAQFADRWSVDLGEAIRAANSQPFSHVHQPGVGVGGHCIPVYPYFLLNDGLAGDVLTLAREARRANDGMAAYAVEALDRALGGLSGRRVLVLGWTYRENVREHFMTSARRLVARLDEVGATPLVHDPLFSAAELTGLGLEPYDLTAPSPIDAVVLQAYHDAYRDLDLATLPGCRVVLDGRNALDPASVGAAGMLYLGVGRGGRVPVPV